MIRGAGSLTLLVCLLLPVTAWAGETRARTSVVPTVGTAVGVHPRLALVAQLHGRFITSGAGPGDRYGVALAAGPDVAVHPILGVFVQYVFAEGRYPLEGPGDREHTARVGLRVASLGKHFVVGNRTALELRTYRQDGSWGFHLRPRSEVRLTGVFRPEIALSAVSEVLMQSSLGRTDMLQVRAGLALHGDVMLGRDDGAEPAPRRPRFFWLAGAQAGLHPVSMARYAAGSEDPDLWAEDRGTTVDVVFGLTASIVY